MPSDFTCGCGRAFKDAYALQQHQAMKHRGGDGTPEPIPCPYCHKPAVYLRSSEAVYNGRDYGPLWICQPCEAWVGCHSSGKPLGRLANKALRVAKQAAHAAFDPIWRTSGASRAAAYAWLAGQLGIDPRDCHIGFFDEETCARAIAACQANPTGPIQTEAP